MTTISIQQKDGKPIDEIVDYILDNFPDLPDAVSEFSIVGGAGTIAGARSKKSLRIVITYPQDDLDEQTMKEVQELLAYLRTLSAQGIEIKQDK